VLALSLLKKKVADDEIIKSKDIDDGTLLNQEEYHSGINDDVEPKKKESIWTRDLSLKKKPKSRKEDKPEKPSSVKLVGIDIGSSYIKVVEGRVKGGKIHIFKMDKLPAPKDVLRDGIIEQVDASSMALKSYLKGHGIKTKNLSFVSSSSTIISRELMVPYVEKQEELKHLVEYEIQQFLCINLNNYEVQYMKIEDVVVDNVEKQKILAIIYPKDIIASYKDLTTRMLLNPYALDLTNNSVKKVANLAKFFNSDLIDKEGTNVFLDLGANTINISIVNRGKLDFIRTLPVGGNDIDRFIANNKDIPMEAAEQIKIEQVEIGRKRETNEVTDGVIRIVDEWIDDLNRIIQFYANKSNGKEISHIYLYGGMSKLKGLDDHMESRLRIETSNVLTVDNVEFDKGLKTSTVEEYINAIGALIRL